MRRNWLPLSVRRAHRSVSGYAPPARRPTQFLPGTPGKVRVMAARCRRCEQIFHHGDAVDSENTIRTVIRSLGNFKAIGCKIHNEKELRRQMQAGEDEEET